MPEPNAPIVKEILFATDFSAASEAAGHIAAAYARQLGARLHILHVVPPGIGATLLPQVKAMAERLGSGVEVTTVVESGAPAEHIVRYAEHAGIDLIIVGTHGRTGVTRAILGSVAERVARTAACPVLTVAQWVRAAAPVLSELPALPSRPEHCLVCAQGSKDLICETCRARIRGETVQRKLNEMRTGRP